jgi:ABC-2 type transport system ATP-binding protein
MIEAYGLTRRYGPVTAIEDISFSVEQGEILGFLGPNGAGKTTTMRILTGYLPPSEGNASIAGHDVFRDSLAARQNLGYLPENVPLYPEMTIAAYLDYMARLRRVPNRAEAVQQAMELVHIDSRADDRISKLSKGYRQRVGLAQALLHNPPVLILDEPTVGLDPRQISEVRELIRALGKDRTIILSTHILPEVSQLCNRVIILRSGRIVAIDTPHELITRLQGSERIYLQLAQPAANAADELGTLEGVESVQAQENGMFEVQCGRERDLRPHLAALAVERGWGLLELRSVGMSLEDVFLQLTTEETHAADEEPPADEDADAADTDAAHEEEAQDTQDTEAADAEKPAASA